MASLPHDPVALQRRLDGLMLLVEITRELAAQHDLEEILQTVTDGVCRALDAERGSLFLYDPKRKELYTRVATELEIAEIRTPLSRGITGRVGRTKQVSNVAEPAADPDWNPEFDRRTGFRTRNILAAPVLSPRDARMVGVLQVLNKRKEDGPFDDFDEQLLAAFSAHAATALERAQLLEEARRAHELQVSVDLGRSIQTSFLPKSLPDVPGYEIAAWWQPAEAVSGDYYDVLRLPDGRIGVVVADVSGHGFGPSLIMASIRAMLRIVTRAGSEPHRILSLLSQTISPDLPDGRFITFLMVALDSRTHELTFANAGHGPALHYRRATGEFRTLQATCVPIGVIEEMQVPTGETLTIDPGDLVLLATDGAFEVRDEHGEMFGMPRLEALVRDNVHLPASQMLAVVRKAINEFFPGPHPPDDVTLLLLERKLHTDAAD